DNIAERLSVRDFMEELRGAGVQTGGPAAFHARDRQAFAKELDTWLARRPG
ncbi:MAG: YaiI/YqxD family protein, partial [Gammaproteobacteria bacterium]|nr:YaiI/YqxD family protein [Gammaproteobacteria bacterium]